jgi:xanthine dehydrogenase accessory factor
MTLYERLRLAVDGEERAVLLTVVEGEPLGAKSLVVGDEVIGDGPAELARGARTGLVEHEGRKVFVDTRAALATRERIPSADELLVGWPDEVLERIGLDEDSAVVVLTHDEKLDTPALLTALRSPAFYVGALGSRRAQAARRERLLEAGLEEADLERLSGPSGLDLGAAAPPETALSILAEVVAVRAGRSGGRLAESSGRIHAAG